MRKKAAKLIIFSITVLLVVSALLFALNFDSAAERFAAFDIKNSITGGINRIYYEMTETYYERLKDAVTVFYGENGKINSITVDSAFLNLFSSEVVTKTILFVEDSASSFGIPLGNITGARILSGLGPKIKVKIIQLGSVAGAVKSSFTEAGINQTLHRVTLEINAVIEVLSPFCSKASEISLSYVISENVIVGDIPNVYFK